jgi:hypothetical protein
VRLDTVHYTAEENARHILQALMERGFLRVEAYGEERLPE